MRERSLPASAPRRRAAAGAAARAPAAPARAARAIPPALPASRPWAVAWPVIVHPQRRRRRAAPHPQPVPARVDGEAPARRPRPRSRGRAGRACGSRSTCRRRAARSNADLDPVAVRLERGVGEPGGARRSPSNAANGRCSGNWANPGESGARTERGALVPRRPSARRRPRSGNGSSSGGVLGRAARPAAQRRARRLPRARGHEHAAAVRVAHHDLGARGRSARISPASRSPA